MRTSHALSAKTGYKKAPDACRAKAGAGANKTYIGRNSFMVNELAYDDTALEALRRSLSDGRWKQEPCQFLPPRNLRPYIHLAFTENLIIHGRVRKKSWENLNETTGPQTRKVEGLRLSTIMSRLLLDKDLYKNLHKVTKQRSPINPKRYLNR